MQIAFAMHKGHRDSVLRLKVNIPILVLPLHKSRHGAYIKSRNRERQVFFVMNYKLIMAIL